MSNKKNNKKVNLLKDQMFLSKKYVDINDPIYNSESEDENCFYTVLNSEEIMHSQKITELKNKQYKDTDVITFETFEEKCDQVLNSFFYDRKVQDVLEKIKEFEIKKYNDYLIFRLIKRSFDYDADCHTNVSCLLNVLYLTKFISTEQIQRAFEKILLSLEDIRLDAPLCYEIFLNYIRFCILDNLIDSTYIFKLPVFFFDQLDVATLTTSNMEQRLSELVDMDMDHLKSTGAVSNEQGSEEGSDEEQCASGVSADRKKFLDTYRDTLQWVLTINIQKNEKEKVEYKKNVRHFLVDFFNDGSTDEVVEFLKGHSPLFRHEFVRICIVESFSKSNICRKMVSHVLDQLCGRELSKDDIGIAFLRIIGQADVYELDCPNAREYICKFLLRCIYDDVLYPAFLSDGYRIHLGGVTGMSICNKTQQRINNKKKMNSNNINYIWDEDDCYETMRLKRIITNSLWEYFYEFINEEECYFCFQDALPIRQEFILYIIKKMFLQNLEVHKDCDMSLRLLDLLYQKNYVETADIQRGLQIILTAMDDIILDIPKLPEIIRCVLRVLLDKNYVTQQFYDESVAQLAKY